ncbi:MAG: type 1 glutamine amidotransferase [Nitrospiraceae bacterium]|nr:type 1 glutamine amidotransferase [Nitrospiraceae bacterium]
MSVLILKNITSEGPGTIETFLKEKSVPYRIIDLYAGEAVPDTSGFNCLVMLGGPMCANEKERYPFIEVEEAMAREFAARGKRVLGICLGAQIMANAFGGRVYKGYQKESGWLDIELTEDGIRDKLMRALAVHPSAGDFWRRFKVFHWHGDTFEIPGQAARLCGSDMYANQALRYGHAAYAFQFHIEATKEMIYEWMQTEDIDQAKLRQETEQTYDICSARAYNFYESFFAEDIRMTPTALTREADYEKD